MSWSAATLESQSKSSIEVQGTAQTVPDGVGETYDHQLQVCKDVAALLAEAVGGASDKVVVTMGGHANPNHEAFPGSAAETLFVSVTAVPDTTTVHTLPAVKEDTQLPPAPVKNPVQGSQVDAVQRSNQGQTRQASTFAEVPFSDSGNVPATQVEAPYTGVTEVP